MHGGGRAVSVPTLDIVRVGAPVVPDVTRLLTLWTHLMMSPVVVFVVVRTLLVSHAPVVALVVHEAAVGVRLGGVVPGGAG